MNAELRITKMNRPGFRSNFKQVSSIQYLVSGIIFICLSLLNSSSIAQSINDPNQQPVSMDSLFRKKAMESIGKSFPQFSVTTDGRVLTNDSLEGKIVFINFWFEACPPCIAELNALNKLYNKFSTNKNFEFISFTYESPARIKRLKQKYHMQYRVFSITNQECYRLNQNNGFPTSIILDKTGTIKQLYTGGTTDKKEAENFIRNIVYKSIDEALKN